ncbi:MAG: hypothetical protein KDC45_11595 [Bacteroidetes bacterium]|nr:hypothetical protein [Bacteroidota bacterium]
MIKLLVFYLLLLTNTVWTQTAFAIFPTEVGSGVPQADREKAESSFLTYLIQSGKYQIIDRMRIEQVAKEQNFQLSDLSDQQKLANVGKLLGADKLVTSRLFKKGGDVGMSVSVVDVTTGQIELNHEESDEGYSASSNGRFCATQVINKYPLLGKVLGKSGPVFVINLGKTHGLKPGDRIFAARKTVLKGEKGEILFESFARVGLLEVQQAEAGRSVVKVRSLVESGNSVDKDDIVSPEPIPEKEPIISSTPLLPNITTGDLLLDDDMKSKQYLTVTNNDGPSYEGGALNMDATKDDDTHSYCYYPEPFTKLDNFVFECEVEFLKKETSQTNRMSIVVKANSEYVSANNYAFFLKADGKFSYDLLRNGTVFTIIPTQSSPLIKRGESKNKIRIVSYDSKFDVYMNGEFLIGMDHELYEKGGIGFWCNRGSRLRVDNVKIWEAVKK